MATDAFWRYPVNPDIPPPSTPSDPDDDEPVNPDVEEFLESIVDLEAQRRLWLRAILPMLQSRLDVDVNDRVQWAYDKMRIAACERMVRLLGSDLVDDPAA